jgi:peroxiredoxin
LQALAIGLGTPGAMVQGAGAQGTSGSGLASQPAQLELGQTLKLPSLTLHSGERLESAYFVGHTTVLYWWASWCPFCREQTPEMQKLWQRHAAQGLRMLAISVDVKAEAALQHWQRGGFTFPMTMYSEDLARVLSRPKGIPVTVMLDPRGRVAQIERGQMFPEDVVALSRWLP